MKKVIRLTESDVIRLVKKIIRENKIISEGIEHTKKLYASWANKKSGNPEKAMEIMDDVLQNLKKLPKRNFADYGSYEELLADLDSIKNEKPKEAEKFKSQNATRLYEDDDLLVVAPNTWEASCKYGAGSKWCTTSKDTDIYWKRHNQTGTEFFWIFKNKPQSDPNYKFSYHLKVEGGEDWCNSVNICMKNLPKGSYPLNHPKYSEIISKLKEFHNKRDEIIAYKKLNASKIFIQTFVKDLVKDNFEKIKNMIYAEIPMTINGVLDFYYQQGKNLLNKSENERLVKDLQKISKMDAKELERINHTIVYGGFGSPAAEALYPRISWIIEEDINILKNYGVDFNKSIEDEIKKIDKSEFFQKIVKDKNFDESIKEIPNEYIWDYVNNKLSDMGWDDFLDRAMGIY